MAENSNGNESGGAQGHENVGANVGGNQTRQSDTADTYRKRLTSGIKFTESRTNGTRGRHTDFESMRRLTTRNAVRFNSVDGYTVQEISIGVADIIGAESIVSVSRANRGIIMYLDSIDKVAELCSSGITVDNEFIQVEQLVKPAKRVIISGIEPFIPNECLTPHLEVLGRVLPNSLRYISASIKTPRLSHVLSHRREVLILLNDTNADVNGSIEIKHMEKKYRVFISSDSMKCFQCKQSGHLRKDCPQMQNDTHIDSSKESFPDLARYPQIRKTLINSLAKKTSTETNAATNQNQPTESTPTKTNDDQLTTKNHTTAATNNDNENIHTETRSATLADKNMETDSVTETTEQTETNKRTEITEQTKNTKQTKTTEPTETTEQNNASENTENITERTEPTVQIEKPSEKINVETDGGRVRTPSPTIHLPPKTQELTSSDLFFDAVGGIPLSQMSGFSSFDESVEMEDNVSQVSDMSDTSDFDFTTENRQAEFLKDQLIPDEEMKKFLDSIKNRNGQIKRCLAFCSDLKKFSASLEKYRLANAKEDKNLNSRLSVLFIKIKKHIKATR